MKRYVTSMALLAASLCFGGAFVPQSAFALGEPSALEITLEQAQENAPAPDDLSVSDDSGSVSPGNLEISEKSQGEAEEPAAPVFPEEPSAPTISDMETADIDEGVYEVSSDIAGNRLDVAGGSTTNNANAQSYAGNNTPAQRWRIEKHGGHYLLINVMSGKALDVTGGVGVSGTNVQQYDVNYTNAQLWDFVVRADGGYYLRSCLGDLVLDISGGSTASGANVQLYSWNATRAQIWNLIKIAQTVDDGLYRLGSLLDQNKVIDVSGGSIDNSANVQIYGSNETLAQYWTVSYDSRTGYYTLRSAASGKLLDCRGGGTSSGTALQQYGQNGTAAQWWRIVKNPDGTVSLYSAKSGLALDIPGANLANGSGLQLYASNGTAAQKWYLLQPGALVKDGLYQIVSRIDACRVFDVSGGSLSDDAKPQVWNKNGTLAQKWSVSVCDDGTVLIKNANSGKYLTADGSALLHASSPSDGSHWVPRVSPCGGLILVNAQTGQVLDLSGANTNTGTVVQLYSSNSTAAQAWRLLSAALVDDGWYILVDRDANGAVLDVAGASGASGTRVQLYGSNGTGAQKWYVRSLGNDIYELTAFVSSKKLDVLNASAFNGAKIQQWDGNGSAAQKWRFKLGEHGGIEIYSVLADGTFALVSDVNGLTLNDSSAHAWRLDATAIWEQPLSAANTAQKRLVDIANTVPSPGANLCSEWISLVYNKAGYGYENGDACDLFWRYCHSTDRSQLKVGMIVAIPSHSHNWAGSLWGHVAIYIGDGMVMENVGRIKVTSLNDWCDYYGTTYAPSWGWYRNTALC